MSPQRVEEAPAEGTARKSSWPWWKFRTRRWGWPARTVSSWSGSASPKARSGRLKRKGWTTNGRRCKRDAAICRGSRSAKQGMNVPCLALRAATAAYRSLPLQRRPLGRDQLQQRFLRIGELLDALRPSASLPAFACRLWRSISSSTVVGRQLVDLAGEWSAALLRPRRWWPADWSRCRSRRTPRHTSTAGRPASWCRCWRRSFPA